MLKTDNANPSNSISKFGVAPTNLKKQLGVSFGVIIFNLIIAGFVAFTVVKIGGLYYDDYLISKSLNSLKEESFITKKSSRAIFDLLQQKNRTNNIRLENPKDAYSIKKQSNKLVVDLNYERRTHVVSNIDLVLTFSHNLEIAKN